jgi:hypothetical protein
MMRIDTQSAPPKILAPPSLTVFAAIVLGATALGAGAMVFFFNPNAHGFYPICLFHQLTGLNCPGCGGTRAAYALLHGNVALALKDNSLFLLLIPTVALRGVWLAGKKFLGRPIGQFIPAKSLWWLLAVTVMFTVLRNLPAFAFLSP